MKTRPLSTLARMIGLISLLLLLLALPRGSTRAQGGVIPTDEWVNFFSTNTTFLGQSVPVGAVIAAFDPDGVQCGAFTVLFEGTYGVMPCYRDDDTTPDIDEGADPGDLISFTIDGLPARPVGPDDPIWTSNGDLLQVDLEVVATPTPTPTATASPSPTPTGTATPTPTATATPIQTPTPTSTATATPTAAPLVILAPGSLTFGPQTVASTSPPQTVSLTNNGNADLVIGSLTLTGANPGDFAVANDTCSNATVAPRASCTFDVLFTPTVPGVRTAAVSIPSNAAGSPHVVALSGIGIAPAVRPVGGYGEPLSPLELWGPWIILVTGVVVGALGAVALRRRMA